MVKYKLLTIPGGKSARRSRFYAREDDQVRLRSTLRLLVEGDSIHLVRLRLRIHLLGDFSHEDSGDFSHEESYPAPRRLLVRFGDFPHEDS